ncbi:DMT family transporter [uncultured Clostridium sp.]|uniref:DMT family transporter n=1 Tax=uncultured Clostridium sp. TaxID=59620 RepID=UPI0025D77F90|nr:DMT family transporter [uncultured Clostridium sp.]NLU07241.1 DMT family transporter [Clostridiales bacterium]
MLGILYSIVAGISMSVQGVFNTRLSEKIGLWATNTLVQGSGFVITLAVVLLSGRENWNNIGSCKKLYFLGGALGVIITFTVMQGIKSLGTTYSISIILVSQLLAAALIDFWGLFDSAKMNFAFNKVAGIIIMIIGILVLKWKN